MNKLMTCNFRLFLAGLLLFGAPYLTGCNKSDDDDNIIKTGDDDDDDIEYPEIENIRVRRTIENRLAMVAEVTFADEVRGYLEFGPFGKKWSKTEEVVFPAGATTETLLLGLRPGQKIFVRPVVLIGDRYYPHPTSYPAIAGDTPEYLGEASIDYEAPSLVGTSQEAFCHVDKAYPSIICRDRSAEPIWYFENYACPPREAFRSTSQGKIAYYCKEDDGWSDLVIIDNLGRIEDQYDLEELVDDPDVRFTHYWMHHDLIEITEGKWKGALAVLTNTGEKVSYDPADIPANPDPVDYLGFPFDKYGAPIIDEPTIAGGFIIVNPQTGDILWDWNQNGAPGDNQPISPELLPYTRRGIGQTDLEYPDGSLDWVHTNAILHEVDNSGHEYFWLSLRNQDWVIKIDTETDKIMWRFGYQGDFKLVKDIEADDPVYLAGAEEVGAWFSRQHAPEFISSGDGRFTVLLFDNGHHRPTIDGGVSYEKHYSRLVVYEIDEARRLAQMTFEYGAPDGPDHDYFYNSITGDADMAPNGKSIVFISASGDQPGDFIGEVTYPGGELLWRIRLLHESFGVEYFPTLYDLDWRYR